MGEPRCSVVVLHNYDLLLHNCGLLLHNCGLLLHDCGLLLVQFTAGTTFRKTILAEQNVSSAKGLYM